MLIMNKKRISAGIIALLIFSTIAIAKESGDEFLCTYVIDGDTIVVNYKIKVRLIGIDTPESGEFFYEEAKRYLTGAVHKKRVLLKYGDRARDRFGRVLAYVYLDDGTFLNEELIRRGFGEVFHRDDYEFKERFLKLQEYAKRERKGIWRKGRR